MAFPGPLSVRLYRNDCIGTSRVRGGMLTERGDPVVEDLTQPVQL